MTRVCLLDRWIVDRQISVDLLSVCVRLYWRSCDYVRVCRSICILFLAPKMSVSYFNFNFNWHKRSRLPKSNVFFFSLLCLAGPFWFSRTGIFWTLEYLLTTLGKYNICPNWLKWFEYAHWQSIQICEFHIQYFFFVSNFSAQIRFQR